MGRRRRKRDDDLAAAIVVLVILMVFAYPAKLEMGVKVAMALLLGGGLISGIVLLIRKGTGSNRPVQAPIHPASRTTSRLMPDIGPLEKESQRRAKLQAGDEGTRATKWSLELIKELDWKRFEDLCVGYFQAKGRKAHITDLGADGGVDVLLYGDSNPHKVLGVVQCKAWSDKPVGVRQIRELLGVMTDVGCPMGIFITTSDFTPDAVAFAEGKHIQLLNGPKLFGLVLALPAELQTELLGKITAGDYKTPSCPSCGVKLQLRKAHRGKSAGSEFWGCPNYPSCRYSMPKKP